MGTLEISHSTLIHCIPITEYNGDAITKDIDLIFIE